MAIELVILLVLLAVALSLLDSGGNKGGKSE